MVRTTTPPRPPKALPVDREAPTDHDWLARLAARVEPTAGRETSLVRLVIQAVHQAIDEGELRPGTRLPSVRALARQLGISTFTVAEAYAELAARPPGVARPVRRRPRPP